MRYYKNLSIDETSCTVEKEGHPIHLTAMEYQLFVTLLDHSGRVTPRNLLLSSLGISQRRFRHGRSMYISRKYGRSWTWGKMN